MAEQRQWATQIFQVVCVVESLERTLENWKRIVEFNQASIRYGITPETASCVYHGRWTVCHVRYVRFDFGGIEMKLVEPMNKAGDDPYADALREQGQGFHHLGIYVKDYDAMMDAYREMGLQPVFEGMDGAERMQLYDLREHIGMMVSLKRQMTGPCARTAPKKACGVRVECGTKLKMDVVCQVAVVVKDLEAGLRAFRKLLGIDETTLSYSDSRDAYAEGRLKEVRYYGKEGVFRYVQHNFSMGGMDIEMFAPIPGVQDAQNPFTDFLKEHGPGIHHLNIRMANREEGIQFLRETLGLQPFYDLYHLGRNCTYYDLREMLGLVIEYGMRLVGPRASLTEDDIERLTAY